MGPEAGSRLKQQENWLYRAIDLLASEYGWSQDYILDFIYPEDVINYQKTISKRKYADYLMLLVIAHNPYTEEPEALFEQLRMETGMSYLDQVEPDREGLKALQGLISPNMER